MKNLAADFIVNNYILIVAMTGLWLSTYMNINLSKYMIRLIRECVLIVLSLTLIEYADNRLAAMDTLSNWRLFVKALSHSISPFLIIQAIRIICGIRKYKFMLIPALINIVISFSVFFTDIAYYYTSDNRYFRGPLGTTTYIVSLFYVLLFLVIVTRYFRKNTVMENIVIIFMAVNAMCAMFIRLYMGVEPMYKLLFTIDIVFYFLFLHIQQAKLDQLTGLLNRQTFFIDMDKYKDVITGIITIDMNELKWINDSRGHGAGDEAIKTVSRCFAESINEPDRLYRVGGDEFQIMCIRRSEEEINNITAGIREALDKTEFSCAIGTASVNQITILNENKKIIIDDLLAMADQSMYEDKTRIKQEILKNGGVLHSRK